MTRNQGDQKTKNMLISQALLRCRLTALKRTSQKSLASNMIFSLSCRPEFHLHLPARCAGSCRSSDNNSLKHTLAKIASGAYLES